MDTWFWIGFHVFIALMLLIDIGLVRKDAHEVKMKEALWWSALWIGLALIFNVGVWYWGNLDMAKEFATAYVIEKSLSVDNLFVFLTIFSYFRVPAQYQHKVLFWGIVGALLMRAVFITLGVAVIQMFSPIMYVFGAILVITGVKLFFKNEDKPYDPEYNWALRITRKLFRISSDYRGDAIFFKENGLLYGTPLFIVLILIETTDLIFAVDSIPAVLAIFPDHTKDHVYFIAYTSNIFAILGLRSLYFALAGMMKLFDYLHYGLAIILCFIGAKMLVAQGFGFHIPTGIALGVVLGVLALSIVASLVFRKPQPEGLESGE